MRLNDCYPTILNWRNSLFKDDDERWMDEKAQKGKGTGASATPAVPTQSSTSKSKRFFYMTSNIDGDVEKVGFSANEVFETKGNIINWQCAIPCIKVSWRIDDEFRFEVGDNGKANPIKYVESQEGRRSSKQEPASIPSVGDAEDFNFYDPHGRFHYDKAAGDYNDYITTPRVGYNSRFATTPRAGRSVSKKSNQFLTHNLLEQRTMYFRYFLPDVADQVKNPEQYYRPDTRQTLNSTHSSNGILHPLQAVHSLAVSKGSCKAAIVQRHNLFSGSNEGHEEIHQLTFKGALDSRDEGVFEVQIVDPFIHETSFYTRGLNEELVILQQEREKYLAKLKTQIPTKEDLLDDFVVPGSDSTFAISLRFRDFEEQDQVSYFYRNVKPSIRKKRESSGLYVDTVIVNVQEEPTTIDMNDHIIPSMGLVSLLVQPLTKNSSTIGDMTVNDDKPWQLFGEYSIDQMRTINPNTDSRGIMDKQSSGRLIDLILNSKDSLHKLRIRAIQYESTGHIEIVTIFIDMPISKYGRLQINNNKDGSNEHGKDSLIPNRVLSSKALEKERIEHDLKARENKIPVMNRQFCQHCRGLARPRVKMLQDKGFIPGSSKRFKQWCMDVKKAMTAEPDKKLVILELGAEGPLRTQSDLFLKQTQAYGATLIRVNPSVRMRKGAKEGASSTAPKGLNSEDAFQLIEDESCIGAIQKIDSALRMICEKFKFPIEDILL